VLVRLPDRLKVYACSFAHLVKALLLDLPFALQLDPADLEFRPQAARAVSCSLP
jgi:hypothetical protein